jgi:CRISPR-associated protein Csm1
MSLQIFLNGKIHGTEEFLRSAADDFEGRAQWVTLLSEILPRALLAEFGLSKMLLGASGGGQFLMVLPEEFRDRAAEFCDRASNAINEKSGGSLRLAHAFTEVLGNWADIRKRLQIELDGSMSTPGFTEAVSIPAAGGFETRYRRGTSVGWSPEHPAEITPGEGSFTWALGDEVPFADHTAPDDEGNGVAPLNTLASRATGRWMWGVLRADIDDFDVRLRRANTVEEHLQLTLMYSQFLSNELQMRCSLPEYWQNVQVLYASGSKFAVAGAWDSLIGLAREMQRIFGMFVESNLREFAGTEGKTVSMALALAPEDSSTLASVYAEAGDKLELARAAGRDSVWVLGRALEWKQLADAADSRVTMTRLIREFGASRQFLDELAAFYRDTGDTIVSPGARRTNTRVDKPWRFYRRLNSVLAPSGRSKEYQRLRSDLISDFTGRRASNIRLRPQGRVALEWARLETGLI